MTFESNKNEVEKEIEKAIKRALEGVGSFLHAEASLRAPVDTGMLRSSINYSVDEPEKTVRYGTNVEYAIYVEKGTYKQKAQPFLSPAANENIGEINKLIGELMKID